MTLVLLIGGARSGKSALAVELGRAWAGPVTFIATAEPRDEEIAERIRRHRSERPADWPVVEETWELGAALARAAADDAVIIDCVSLWVANLVERGDSDDEIAAAAREVATEAAARATPTVAVTNEVGLGLVPAAPLGRRYRDVLGRANAAWADAAEDVALVVAGRALRLDRADAVLQWIC